MGLSRAGYQVVGVDIEPQREYPFEFIRSDVFALLSGRNFIPSDFINEFDFIWASPPCQAYSRATPLDAKKHHPDLIAKTRELLTAAGIPFCIENVLGAPLRRDLLLCGTMFNLKVLRHRLFEIERFTVPQPYHPKHNGTTRNMDFITVGGNGVMNPTNPRHKQADGWYNNRYLNDLPKATKQGDVWKYAMGIVHINKKQSLANAVPPAYSEYIASHCHDGSHDNRAINAAAPTGARHGD